MNETPQSAAIEMCEVTVSAMRDLRDIVVEGVNWSVAAGEFWVVAGAPYSGKSNFLMMTAGLTFPLSGSYKFFGRELRTSDLAPPSRPGLVFEGGRLFNRLTIAENVALPLRYHTDLTDAEVESKTQELLELAGLSWFAESLPPNVSSNWLTRAGLARALALRPQVLLLDNPARGLDAEQSQWWVEFLENLCQGHEWLDGAKMAVIVTADDLRPWRGGARRFAVLNERRFVRLGAWNEACRANHPLVKTLLAVPLTEVIHGPET